MKSEYRCLICGEKYGSHITAIHKLLKFLSFEKNKGQTNEGSDEESILIENN